MATQKQILVPQKKISEFIKKYAPEEDNWGTLSDRMFKELKIRLTRRQLSDRGFRLQVRTKGLTTNIGSVPQFSLVSDGSDLAKQVLSFIRRKRTVHTIDDVANALVTSPQRIKDAVLELQAAGHTVNLAEGALELGKSIAKSDPIRLDKKLLDGNKFRFLLTADNHLCNKHERLDVLNALFDIADGEGITNCYQLGNMIDGDHHFNKHEVICRGLDAQSTYLAEHWPKKKGMTTHFITGDDHEGWYINREGIDVGFYIERKFEENGRKDFKYLGHVEADVLLPGRKRRAIMRLIHAGGGTAYATSYTTQKIVESYQGGEKPRILGVGHYHKANFDYSREVYTFQGGCTCDQTTFMRKKRIPAHVGGWIIELTISDDGDVIRTKGEWIPFYDKGTYDKAWKARGIK